jgi:hypothetical protein
MGPKYSAGNKVRIKSQIFPEKNFDTTISLYENMTGEIIESANIVAFIHGQGAGEQITIYHYTVKITEKVILHDVLEDWLEIVSPKKERKSSGR